MTGFIDHQHIKPQIIEDRIVKRGRRADDASIFQDVADRLLFQKSSLFAQFAGFLTLLPSLTWRWFGACLLFCLAFNLFGFAHHLFDQHHHFVLFDQSVQRVFSQVFRHARGMAQSDGRFAGGQKSFQ